MIRGTLLFLSLAGAAAAAVPQSTDEMHASIARVVKTRERELIDLRRDLHRHPELSGQESRTAALIASRLKAAGLEVRTGIGGHGVVGVLRGARPGGLVAYRADMDAVRSTHPDPAPFASTIPGVRHICGHDVHVAIGVGLAEALAGVRAQLAGRVMFIFQPAEERATGARAMLDAGVFTPDPPAAIFGLHSAPLEAGRITSKAGLMMHPNQVAPGVTNDAALYATTIADLKSVIGAEAFIELEAPPPGFSEDFGEFQKQVPGVFFFLGLSNGARGIRAMPHDPSFDVDESAIAFGIRAMAAVVVPAARHATIKRSGPSR